MQCTSHTKSSQELNCAIKLVKPRQLVCERRSGQFIAAQINSLGFTIEENVRNLILIACFIAGSLLSSCNSGGEISSPVASPLASLGPNEFRPTDWKPLPGRSELSISNDVREARERLLGPTVNDLNTVSFWWYGVSSFIVSMGGHLFLLDAWEIVGIHANYVPITKRDLVAIQPEAIFIGHGHFDHAGDTGFIASNTQAAVVGSENMCKIAKRQARDRDLPENFKCLVVGTREFPAPGVTQSVKVWEDLPPVHVIQHLHSDADPMDLANGGSPLVYFPTLLPFIQNLNTDPEKYRDVATTASDDNGTDGAAGGTWSYHFTLGDFSFFWNDSAGPISRDTPDGVAIQNAFNSLPGCTDVHLGAILGFGMFTSEFQDPLEYVKSIQSQVFLPNHHDAFVPVIGGGASAYEQQWTEAFNTLPRKPEMDYLKDPEDYMKVRTFEVSNPRWQNNAAGCIRD